MENKGRFKPGYFTKEELVKNAKKGTALGNAVLKRKKILRDIAQTVFTDHIEQRNILELIKEAGFDITLTMEEALVFKLFQRALSDDKRRNPSFKMIRFLAGESEQKTMRITNRIKW